MLEIIGPLSWLFLEGLALGLGLYVAYCFARLIEPIFNGDDEDEEPC